MAIIPADFTAALQQANIDGPKAAQLGTTITGLISNLQVSDTTNTDIPDASLAQTISNVNAANSKLKDFWIDNPVMAHTTVIPQASTTLTALTDIHTSVVTVLEPAGKYSATLYNQLQAVDTAAAEIRKYIYPKLSTTPTTKTVVDDMSLTNLKIYSSFLGLVSKSADQRSAWIDKEVEMLETIKSWLDQYQSELQRSGV